MGALIISLAAAISWGVADFLGGSAARAGRAIVVATVAQGSGLVLLVLVAVLAGFSCDVETIAVAAASGLAIVAGVTALYAGLARGPMSVVATIAGLGVVVPVVYGIATGDQIAVAQAIGMVLAVFGVILVTQHESLLGDLRRSSFGAPLLGVLAALGLGASMIGLQHGAELADPVSSSTLTRGWAVVILALALLVIRPPVGATAAKPLPAIAVGIFDAGGVLLFTLASTLGSLGVAAVLASLYPLVTIGLALKLLDESIRPSQGVGVCLAFTGVLLIALGA